MVSLLARSIARSSLQNWSIYRKFNIPWPVYVPVSDHDIYNPSLTYDLNKHTKGSVSINKYIELFDLIKNKGFFDRMTKNNHSYVDFCKGYRIIGISTDKNTEKITSLFLKNGTFIPLNGQDIYDKSKYEKFWK